MAFENEAEEARSSLLSACKYLKINQLLCIQSANFSDKQLQYIKTVTDNLSESGINAVIAKVSQSDGQKMDESLLLENQGAILVINSKDSSIDDINAVIERCCDYNIPVLGSIYLG